MSEKVGTEKIEPRPGYLLFVAADGAVWGMKIGDSSAPHIKVSTEKISREPGYLYFVNTKDGFVYKSPVKKIQNK